MSSLTIRTLTVISVLAALAIGVALTTTGCGGGVAPVIDPGLEVVQVVDQYNREVGGTVDLTKLAVGWKVHVRPTATCCSGAEIKASAYDSKATMTHGSFPTNPTVGDEFYYNGRYYGYCGQAYGWIPRIPGASSVTADGSGGVWVTFATVDKAMAVVIVMTLNDQTMGMPLVIGVDPDYVPSVSFPPITNIVIGQTYVLVVDGGLSWQIPAQGIALYTNYGGTAYMIGTMIMNADGDLVVTFNQNLQTIINMIGAGTSQELTVTYTVSGNTYNFTINVTGGGGGSADTPSTITVTGLTNGATVSGTVAVNVTASDTAGVSGIVFLVDGNAIGSGTGSPYSYSWNTTTLTDGAHVITIRVTDGNGNVTTWTVNVIVDNGGGDDGSGGAVVVIG